jgi:hypothetical protein
MFTLVQENFFWDIEWSNKIVKKEASCHGCIVIECRHVFIPLSEIIERNNKKMVETYGCWETLHTINPPLVEWISVDYEMKWSWSISCLVSLHLIIGTMFGYLDGIRK